MHSSMRGYWRRDIGEGRDMWRIAGQECANCGGSVLDWGLLDPRCVQCGRPGNSLTVEEAMEMVLERSVRKKRPAID